MKTLSKENAKVMSILFSKMLKEKSEVKQINLKAEIIAKFGLEAFEEKEKERNKSVKKEIVSDPIKELNVAEIKKDAIEILSNELNQIVETNDADVTNDLIKSISALGISEKIKESTGKSIFKKEFNNKTDRTKCRSLFLNQVQIFLLHLAHKKTDLAKTSFEKLKEIAKKYYLAEDKFLSVADYATNGMDENKRQIIDLFIKNKLVEV